MVDSSVQLSIVRHTYCWKVVVERCTHYLGQHSITRALSHEEGTIEWESNQKFSLRVLSLSWIFDLVGGVCSCGYCLQARVGHFDDWEAAFQAGLGCEKSAVDRT